MPSFHIKLDDLTDIQVIQLLEEHLADMQATSPPESKHALDLTELKSPSVKFWVAWSQDENGTKNIAGCIAYQRLDDNHAEIKSMRTATQFKNQGVASLLLNHIMDETRKKGFNTLSLETGSMDYFKPARTLYEKHGFSYCQPFSHYKEDPNSQFMTLRL